MSKKFTNLDKLLQYFEKATIKQIVNRHSPVVEKAIEVSKDKVDKVVYDVYSPKVYERTYQLRDSSWEVVELPDGSGVEIANTRSDGNRDVAYIVHTGKGYMFPFEYSGKERPFMEVAVEELNKTGVLSDVLIKELERKGFRVDKVSR